MAISIVTNHESRTSRPREITVAPTAQEAPAPALQHIAPDAGINPVFLTDMLSAFAMHERNSARFSRAAAELSAVDELRALHTKQAHEHTEHLATLEALMRALKLDPLYTSPAALMAGYRDEGLMEAPLLAGSVDPHIMELTLIEIALAMAEMDLANAQALAEIATRTRPSALRDALHTAAWHLDLGDTTTLEAIRAARKHLVVAGALEQSR